MLPPCPCGPPWVKSPWDQGCRWSQDRRCPFSHTMLTCNFQAFCIISQRTELHMHVTRAVQLISFHLSPQTYNPTYCSILKWIPLCHPTFRKVGSNNMNSVKKDDRGQVKALVNAGTLSSAKSVAGQLHVEELWWQQEVKRQRDRESKMKWEEVEENVGAQCERLCERFLNSELGCTVE